jgi:hypothetical protein
VGEAVGMFVWIGVESVQAPVLAMRSPRRGPHRNCATVKDVRDDFHTTAMIYLNLDLRVLVGLGISS